MNLSVSDTPEKARMASETLAAFFTDISTGCLFDSTPPRHFEQLRKDIAAALVQLLVWDRPWLEATCGLDQPYTALQTAGTTLEAQARRHPSAFVRHQARLFLALLPFPNQWQWLSQLEKQSDADPEIHEFLQFEHHRIQKKIHQKKQKKFKLRHFCQVLKRPRLPREKGVLRIFSLPYLFLDPALLNALSRNYVLYVEPPMGIVFRHSWWRAFAALTDPVMFGVGSAEDALFLKTQCGTVTTSLAHGDFMNAATPVTPRSAPDCDIVFNASFDDLPRKRHRLMLQLLKHPRLQHATALFLGRGTTESVRTFRHQIEQCRLQNRVTVISNLRRSEIPEKLARARIGVHLSLYENACRSIYEFFRSDLPCVISSSMGGMNLNLFNNETGMAVPDADLAKTIAAALDRHDQFSPRAWFLRHSGSLNSSRKLNAQLRQLFLRQGYSWHEDIVALTSSGASRYLDSADYTRFRPEFDVLLRCFRRHLTPQVSLTVE